MTRTEIFEAYVSLGIALGLDERTARKRATHASSYGMGPRTFRESLAQGNHAGKDAYIFSEELQGDPTYYDRWLGQVKTAHLKAYRSLTADDYYFKELQHTPDTIMGYTYGFTPDSQIRFMRVTISQAVKQTIEEHYGKETH